MSVDLRVALFTIGIALVTTVLFGLAPALRALKIDLVDSLKDGSQGASSSGARQRFRNALVVVEMALAVVLLIGAGLTLRSLWALERIAARASTLRRPDDAGGAAGRELPEPGTGRRASTQRLIDQLRQLPGVTRAGAARSLPLGSTIGDFGLTVEGFVPRPARGPRVTGRS